MVVSCCADLILRSVFGVGRCDNQVAQQGLSFYSIHISYVLLKKGKVTYGPMGSPLSFIEYCFLSLQNFFRRHRSRAVADIGHESSLFSDR